MITPEQIALNKLETEKRRASYSNNAIFLVSKTKVLEILIYHLNINNSDRNSQTASKIKSLLRTWRDDNVDYNIFMSRLDDRCVGMPGKLIDTGQKFLLGFKNRMKAHFKLSKDYKNI